MFRSFMKWFVAVALMNPSLDVFSQDKSAAYVEFDAMKRQILSDLADSCKWLKRDIALENKWYLADHCRVPPSNIGGWDDNRDKTRQLLNRLLQFRSSFQCLGIKSNSYTSWFEAEYRDLWRNFLNGYVPAEADSKSRKAARPNALYTNSAWDRFALNLVNTQRQQSWIRLPLATLENPGCGDGEVTVEIEKHPAGGNLQVIDEFAFKVCRLRGVDPYKTDVCPGWVELASRKIQLSGIYYYRFSHSGYMPKTGRFEIGMDFNGPLSFMLSRN